MLGLAPFAAANAAALKFNDEDAANITVMQASGTTTLLQLATPVFCANIAEPAIGGDKSLSARFGSFVFGAMNAASQQVALRGVAGWSYSPESLTVATDPNLICYVTGPNGVRRASLGIYSDNFEQAGFDPSIQTRVVQLPTINNGYLYRYYVDVTIPAIPGSPATVPYAISDGFDGALFSASNSYYCEGQGQNSPDCRGGATHNNLAVVATYQRQAGLSARYIVTRAMLPSVTLPVSSSPVTAAALFLPEGFDPRLDNNVAPSYGALTDARPEINSSAAAAALATLTEGGNLTGVTVTLDDDTSETVGSLLGAAATLTFNNIDFPVTMNCGSTTPIPATPRVTRTCTFDVVTPDIDYATDVAAGVYAPGVTAKLRIVATDARQQTTTVDLNIHVASSDNDKPVFTISPLAVPDETSGKMQTLTCSLANKGSVQCAGLVNEFLTGVAPAPVGATDEIAAQTAAFVQDTSTGRGGNIACTLDTDSPQIFGLTGAPKLTSSGGGAKVSLSYVLNEAQGSATCTVVVRDAGTFYTGQTASNETKQFRIKVTP